jgi:hypothetical protein
MVPDSSAEGAARFTPERRSLFESRRHRRRLAGVVRDGNDRRRAELFHWLPAGHPEGFIEAFANIYRNFLGTLRAHIEGTEPTPEYLDFPTIQDGVRGMAFIESVVESARSDRKWTSFKDYR